MEQMCSNEMLEELKKFEVELYLRCQKYFDSNFYSFKKMFAIVKENEGRIKTPDDITTAISFLFFKSFKTYWSILLLCKRGFAQDAAILTRSLIENVVDMYWISNKDKKERARKFVNYTIVMRKQIYSKYKKHKIFKLLTPERLRMMGSAEEIEKMYTQVKRDYPNETSWSGKNLRCRAEEKGVDLGYDYEFYYWYFSLLSHSTVGGKLTFTKVEGESEIFFYGPSFSPEIMIQILVLSYKYILSAFIKFNSVFDLHQEGAIKEFYEGLEAISVKRKKEV